MGIDIYMKWDGFTSDDKEKQLQGFDSTIGYSGYLREAYHGSPYATKILVPEAFDYEYPSDEEIEKMTSDEEDRLGYVHIPAKTLRQRLPETLHTAKLRAKNIYNEDIDDDDATIQSFVKFVELSESLEKQGKNPVIMACY